MKGKFIEAVRFMTSSLSSIIDNFVEGLHKEKCKDWKFAIEYALTFKSAQCSIHDEKEFDQEIWEQHQILGAINEKIFTILQKGVYFLQTLEMLCKIPSTWSISFLFIDGDNAKRFKNVWKSSTNKKVFEVVRQEWSWILLKKSIFWLVYHEIVKLYDIYVLNKRINFSFTNILWLVYH